MATVVTTPARVKAKVPVSRMLRLNTDTATLTLTVTTGKKVVQVEYSLERIGSDFGDAFRLTKNVGHPAFECDIYHVHLSDQCHTCECMGFLRHQHCKHVDSLVTLRQLGMI